MDTIDNNVMQDAAEAVIRAGQNNDLHTVKITLNGAHGGADDETHGFRRDMIGTGYEEFTCTVIVR